MSTQGTGKFEKCASCGKRVELMLSPTLGGDDVLRRHATSLGGSRRMCSGALRTPAEIAHSLKMRAARLACNALANR